MVHHPTIIGSKITRLVGYWDTDNTCLRFELPRIVYSSPLKIFYSVAQSNHVSRFLLSMHGLTS